MRLTEYETIIKTLEERNNLFEFPKNLIEKFTKWVSSFLSLNTWLALFTWLTWSLHSLDSLLSSCIARCKRRVCSGECGWRDARTRYATHSLCVYCWSDVVVNCVAVWIAWRCGAFSRSGRRGRSRAATNASTIRPKSPNTMKGKQWTQYSII